MSVMTLTCDRSGMPFGLIGVRDAVAHLAKTFVDGSTDWYALYSDEKRTFRSQHIIIPAPLVIATTRPTPPYVELMEHDVKRVTRRVLFARDGWRCQYCSKTATPRNAFQELTVDHVKPAHLFPSRADATYWENCVAACVPCNRRKGGNLPRDIKGADGKLMLPKCDPKEPHFVQVRFAGRLNEAQRTYVTDYFGLRGREDISL